MNLPFKINSATQQEAQSKARAVERIKEKCGLSTDAWLIIMFNTGCQFVEAQISRPHMADALLMNKELGFWAWWLYFYMQDDEALADYRAVQSPKSYAMYKQRLITLYEAERQFDRFLNSNKKLNGTEI